MGVAEDTARWRGAAHHDDVAEARGTLPPLVINKIVPIFIKIRHPLRFLKIFIILENRTFD